MAKRKPPTERDQLSFDFAFSRTLDTIEQLDRELLTEDAGALHADQTSPAATDRGNRTEVLDDRGNPSDAFIQPAGMEDPRSLGVQQPGSTEVPGGAGGIDSAGTTATPAAERTGGTEPIPGAVEGGFDGARGASSERDPDRTVVPADYTISETDQLGDGGAKTKYRDNITALQVLRQLRTEERAATQSEQARLVRYVGWGGLPQAFDHRNSDWQREFLELSQVLSQEDYVRARRSTQDAHYTSKTVVDGIYQGLLRLGFNGGRILEPSGGIGNFIGLMPSSLRAASQVTSIELDPTTADIARQLYPSATHINRGFQDVTIPAEYFDLCIGNPPFGSQSVYDPHYRELSSFSIHNYFVAKSMETLRPGGLLAFVVSRYFMDASENTARSYVAERAHLLGAIRLPNTAFRRNALTDVTTDILFFQKARAGEVTNKSWVDVGEIRDRETGEPIQINRYFIEHPGQMAGRMVIANTMRRSTPELVPDAGVDLDAAIGERLEILPTEIYQPAISTHGESSEPGKPPILLPDTLKVGSYFLGPSGRIARRLPNVLETHDYVYVEARNERATERIMGMIRIRDCLRDLMLAEQSAESSDSHLAEKRTELNRVYDDFVRRYGYLSAQANRLAMSDDPEYPLLHALESNYDKGISQDTAKKHGVAARLPRADKATIFSKRVLVPKARVARVDSAKDALVVSLNENGHVDIPHMMRLTGKTEDDLTRELKGLIYLHPAIDPYWEPAERYLSGNVKKKLAAAEEAAAKDRRFLENVAALRAVQPAAIDPVDISIQLGSTWVPADVVDRFVGHLCGQVNRRITYQPSLGRWIVRISPGDRTTMTVTWGTADYPANTLLEAILTNSTIQVKTQVGEDEHGRPIYEVDESRTAAAVQKADEIRQAFLDWVWEDKDRRERLATLYNDRFNTNIPTRYDGSHLQLPGTSLGITLRSHQKDGIWRGIQDGTALYDHAVGAGKTLILVGTIMESKRMGLMSKPMLVVPNHLLLQWKDAFYSLYPRANILVAEKSDFQKAHRERLFARIATGEWDAVIVAHSSFKRIGMPDATLDEILREQIDDLTQAMTDLKREDGDRVTIKEMEKARDGMKARLERKANTGAKDRVVTFEDLGVDALLVDEAHEFKNLFITTTLSRISGLGNLRGSDKAFDLFVKCRYLQQRNGGRGVFFATGTPISNTIAELYTMQRYLQYDELKARGIVHFDSWASVFGRVVTGWELDATGVNYRLNSRFSRFQNVPELTTLYRTFADVITQSDLQQQALARGTRFPVPRVRGGRPQNIVVERSPRQASFMGIESPVLAEDGTPQVNSEGLVIKDWNPGSIIHRMEHLPKDPRIDNPLKITNEARKAGLDFRLIDPATPDDPGSKVNAAVGHVYRIWDAWRDRRGTQLVFCDLSTPKLSRRPASIPAESSSDADDESDEDEVPSVSMDEILASSGGGGFSVYEDIRAKLLARGVPASEVRFIHEAATDLQKAKLFDEMNRGEVRILLGSTAKMGAGTNVQRRLVAEHHLDAPWRPSDLEQREGRILRQGNLFYEQDPEGFEVEILRYATKQTYDSRMWQVIEYKAAAIEQFRKGDSLLRVIEDVAGEAANAAEMKAAATGNPLIFLQVKLSTELRQLEALYSNYKRARHSLESHIAWLANANQRCESTLLRLSQEISLRDSNTSPDQPSFEIGGRTYGPKDHEALQGKIVLAMKQAVSDRSETADRSSATRNSHLSVVPVGRYRGFEIEVYAMRDLVQFSVNGCSSYEPDNLRYESDDAVSAKGFLQRLDNFMRQFEIWRRDAEDARDRENREYAKAVAELQTPFAQQERLEMLRGDVRDVMTELKLMQADGKYESKWQPRSLIQVDNSSSVPTTTAPAYVGVKEPRKKYSF